MNSKSTTTALTALIAILIGSLSMAASAAEKHKIQYTKVARQTHSETKMAVGQIPGHEFVTQQFLDTMKPTGNPAWDVVQEHVFNNDRNVDGNGTHRGYSIDIFKNGDQAFCWYEGTHTLTTKDGGAWEVNYQGKCDFFGGTGRFKNLKGSVNYKGHVTPESFKEDNQGEVEY